MNKRKYIIYTVIIVLVTNLITLSLVGIFSPGSLINTKGASLLEIQKYNKVKYLLGSEFVDKLDSNTMLEGAIRGLAESTKDPYTTYLDKEEFESLEVHTKGSYAGIGVVVSVDPKTNLIVVADIIENSPASKTKVKPGDKIIKVGGIEVTGDDFEKAVSLIRGPKQTKVTLTMFRSETKEIFDTEVMRDEVEVKTVKSNMLSNNIGYLRITQFAEKSYDEFSNALASLQAQGMNKLIIDVRDNPGGLLSSVVDISGKIVENKLAVYTIDRQGKKKEYITRGKAINVPIVLLVNDRSASASEILAGVIKDYNRGKLVGVKTYGKGSVQSLFSLGDGSGIKITTAKYYTPKGISINKIGITPDVVVEPSLDVAISTLSIENDNQLQKAVEILKDTK